MKAIILNSKVSAQGGHLWHRRKLLGECATA